jgi:glycosyltransferase involved in cell wall biosynthesis
MACGTPVLGSRVGGVPELVEEGRTGWLVAAGDLDGLCRAMRECLAAAPADLLRMGEAGRARVLERHDVDREAARLARLFAGAARGQRSPGLAVP